MAYVGRPETHQVRGCAMTYLGHGLSDAGRHEDALSVKEAQLSMRRRLGDAEYNILAVQGNLAVTYDRLGRHDSALHMKRDVYSGRLKLHGEEHEETLRAATNYARSLLNLKRYAETKTLLRKTIPVASRVLGNSNHLALAIRAMYAQTLYADQAATLEDLRDAVTTLEETARTARRVLGGAYPTVVRMEQALGHARAVLRARETPSPGSS